MKWANKLKSRVGKSSVRIAEQSNTKCALKEKSANRVTKKKREKRNPVPIAKIIPTQNIGIATSEKEAEEEVLALPVQEEAGKMLLAFMFVNFPTKV